MESNITGEVEYFYYEGQFEEMEDGTFIIELNSVQPSGGHIDKKEINTSASEFEEISDVYTHVPIDDCVKSAASKQKLSIFGCHLCEYTAKKAYLLKRHVNEVHLNIKEHRCDQCEYSAKRKWDLKKHLENKHGPKEIESEKYKCEFCKFVTANKYYLRDHTKKIHTQSGKFVCDLCGYRANFNNCLQRHLNSVHYKKEFTCNLCEYSTFDPSNLNRHIKRQH